MFPHSSCSSLWAHRSQNNDFPAQEIGRSEEYRNTESGVANEDITYTEVVHPNSADCYSETYYGY